MVTAVVNLLVCVGEWWTASLSSFFCTTAGWRLFIYLLLSYRGRISKGVLPICFGAVNLRDSQKFARNNNNRSIIVCLTFCVCLCVSVRERGKIRGRSWPARRARRLDAILTDPVPEPNLSPLLYLFFFF